MSTTVRKPPTPALYATPDVDSDELAGRLAEHLVAVALVRKAPDDPVPFSVWWRVTDALRASTEQPPTAAVEAVDVVLAALQGRSTGPS